MEKLFEEKTDKGLYAEAIWKEKPRDYNAPVFEGMTIGYDADNNKILIDVKAYDADSDTWGMSLQLADEKGKRFINIYNELTDETGYLRSDITSDGIHCGPFAYNKWKEALKPYIYE
jgi:lysophospholipase L1-like esterase